MSLGKPHKDLIRPFSTRVPPEIAEGLLQLWLIDLS